MKDCETSKLFPTEYIRFLHTNFTLHPCSIEIEPTDTAAERFQ